MKRALVLLLALSLLAGVGQAATATIHFNGTDGVTSSLWWESVAGWPADGNNNTGAEPGRILLTRPTDDWYFPAGLFKFDLPADMVGATINSAALTMHETMYNGQTFGAVELRRINTPATWVAGDGTGGDRWGPMDNGVGQFFANYDKASDTGIDWLGNTGITMAAGWKANPFETTALADLIDTQDGVGNGATTIWNLKTWVQNVANGTWDNDGFCLWMGDAYNIVGTGGTIDMRMTRDGEGLTIDYTPVPEPATLALLAGGLLMGLRRKK